jgi:hypothetical protein
MLFMWKPRSERIVGLTNLCLLSGCFKLFRFGADFDQTIREAAKAVAHRRSPPGFYNAGPSSDLPSPQGRSILSAVPSRGQN